MCLGWRRDRTICKMNGHAGTPRTAESQDEIKQIRSTRIPFIPSFILFFFSFPHNKAQREGRLNRARRKENKCCQELAAGKGLGGILARNMTQQGWHIF